VWPICVWLSPKKCATNTVFVESFSTSGQDVTLGDPSYICIGCRRDDYQSVYCKILPNIRMRCRILSQGVPVSAKIAHPPPQPNRAIVRECTIDEKEKLNWDFWKKKVEKNKKKSYSLIVWERTIVALVLFGKIWNY